MTEIIDTSWMVNYEKNIRPKPKGLVRDLSRKKGKCIVKPKKRPFHVTADFGKSNYVAIDYRIETCTVNTH